MEQKIKKILSKYIKIPEEQINENTIIDRSAVAGSIILHRMYASLVSEGFVIENYSNIENYGTLMDRLRSKFETVSLNDHEPSINNSEKFTPLYGGSSATNIGIDIEEIASMPLENDFRTSNFYKMNFTEKEISFCILQPSPLASFAGLFAAKEAIVKANNAYIQIPFNNISIDHLPNGKPLHKEFELSISHTKEVAIAFAIQSINTPSGKISYPSL